MENRQQLFEISTEEVRRKFGRNVPREQHPRCQPLGRLRAESRQWLFVDPMYYGRDEQPPRGTVVASGVGDIAQVNALTLGFGPAGQDYSTAELQLRLVEGVVRRREMIGQVAVDSAKVMVASHPELARHWQVGGPLNTTSVVISRKLAPEERDAEALKLMRWMHLRGMPITEQRSTTDGRIRYLLFDHPLAEAEFTQAENAVASSGIVAKVGGVAHTQWFLAQQIDETGIGVLQVAGEDVAFAVRSGIGDGLYPLMALYGLGEEFLGWTCDFYPD